MDLAAEFLAAQQGLVDAARRGADEVFRNQLGLAELREALKREEDLSAGAIHDGTEGAQVAFQEAAVEDMTGARHLREVNLAEGGSEGVGFVHAFTLLA